MNRRPMFRSLIGVGLAAGVLAACAGTKDDDSPAAGGVGEPHTPADVAGAVAALPEAEVVQSTADGVPQFIQGDLGKVGQVQTEDRIAADLQLRTALSPALAPFRLSAADV